MMFFKAVFALYLAAIALAAPGRPRSLVDVEGVGKLRVNPCTLGKSLSTAVEINDNQIANHDLDGVHIL